MPAWPFEGGRVIGARRRGARAQTRRRRDAALVWLDIMPTTDLPSWLNSTWSRNYIRRASAGGPLGEPDASVDVRYLQTLADGHAFDLRIPSSFALPNSSSILSMDDLNLEQLQALASSSIEGFAGITTSESAGDDTILRWHAAFCFPPQLQQADDPVAVLELIRSGQHETLDVGRAVPTLPNSRGKPVAHWYEHAPDESYEEEWVMLDGFSSRGAHFAAIRPARSGCGACWLGVLGNTFAFVRDVDRDALSDAARRAETLNDALADAAIPLHDKRRLLDCEFSFGRFGQGGGVGGVVEFSSLPWRRGVALATLVGEASSGWEPVRASDLDMMKQAIEAILLDHEKACQKLRDAEANGQAGVAEMMRARGAVP